MKFVLFFYIHILHFIKSPHTPHTYTIGFPRISYETQKHHERVLFCLCEGNLRGSATDFGITPTMYQEGQQILRFWAQGLCYSSTNMKDPSQMTDGILRATQGSSHGAQVLNRCRKVEFSDEGTYTVYPCAFPQQLVQCSSQSGCSKDAVNWLFLFVFNSEYNKTEAQAKFYNQHHIAGVGKFIAPVKKARH